MMIRALGYLLLLLSFFPAQAHDFGRMEEVNAYCGKVVSVHYYNKRRRSDPYDRMQLQFNYGTVRGYYLGSFPISELAARIQKASFVGEARNALHRSKLLHVTSRIREAIRRNERVCFTYPAGFKGSPDHNAIPVMGAHFKFGPDDETLLLR